MSDAEQRVGGIPRRELREGETYVYAVTTDVDCEWCSAKAGEDCHLPPGQYRKNYYGEPFKGGVEQHTCRVDPTREPIGIQHPVTPGYTMAEVELFSDAAPGATGPQAENEEGHENA